MAMSDKKLLQAPLYIEDLTVAYDKSPVLWDVDLQIEAGQLYAIAGPNGAGKSTLIKAALSLLTKVSGSVYFFGKPLDAVREKVAYIPQRSTVDWTFPASVAEIIEMGLWAGQRQLKKSEKKTAIEEVLDLVGMSDYRSRQIAEMSGGQQQRIFLARALAQKAELFLLDEPLAGIDARSEKKIMEIFRHLKAKGKTVVCVHHDLNTLKAYFDRAAFVKQRIVMEGPVESVCHEENYKKLYA